MATFNYNIPQLLTQIPDLSISKLVVIHNDCAKILGKKLVKRFATSPKAVEKTMDILLEVSEKQKQQDINQGKEVLKNQEHVDAITHKVLRAKAAKIVKAVVAREIDLAAPATSNNNKAPEKITGMLGFTKSYPITSKIKPLTRKDSLMSQMLEKLKEGATMADLKKIFAAKDKNSGRAWELRAYKKIRIFHFDYGYGVIVTPSMITLVTKETK